MMPTTLCWPSLVFYRGMRYVAPTRGLLSCELGRSSLRDGELVELGRGAIDSWRRGLVRWQGGVDLLAVCRGVDA